MERLLQSKQKIQKINRIEVEESTNSLVGKKVSKRLKFEQRHQRLTIYLLNSLYDELMELRVFANIEMSHLEVV